MRRTLDLDTWRLFFRVVELGSFTRAAEEAGVETSSVSRRIAGLEAALGCDLLSRQPRLLSTTTAGAEAYERMRAVVADCESVMADLSGGHQALSGEVRVSAAIGFGQEFLTPMVVQFRKHYPDIQVKLLLSDTPADIHADPVDVVFRYGPIDMPGVVARYMATVDFIMCASPDYLARHGSPEHPSDLGKHATLAYGGSRRAASTHVMRDGERQPIALTGPLRLNNVLAMREAAIAGAGICVDLPVHSCARAIREGRLVRVLPGWDLPSCDSYALRKAERRVPRRIKTFIDWMAGARQDAVMAA